MGSRMTPECFQALQTSRSLEPVRWEMELHSFNCQIEPPGAHIFVNPEQYVQVLSWCRGFPLRTHHVIISEAFQPLLNEALQEIPSRRHVRIRNARPAVIVGHDDGDGAVFVERTFYVVRQLDGPGP